MYGHDRECGREDQPKVAIVARGEVALKNPHASAWPMAIGSLRLTFAARHLGLEGEDLPAVSLGERSLLRKPSLRELAEAVGLRHPTARNSTT